MKDFERLLSSKLEKSFSYPVEKAIDIISFHEDEPFNEDLVGSYRYKAFRYPGDIDIRQTVVTKSEFETLSRIENWIQSLVRHVYNIDGYYVSEFKAGLDDAFEYLYENSDNTTASLSEVERLHDSNLINNNIYKLLLDLLGTPDFEEAARNLYVLRWTPSEIIRGFKKLSNNRIKKLRDALMDKTEFIKIDLFVPLDNRYIEVTNNLVLFYKSGRKVVPISKAPSMTYLEAMQKDFKKKFDSGHIYKSLKRLGVVMRLTKNKRAYANFVEFFNRPINIAYQIISDIEVILDMLEKINNPPKNFLRREIDEFRDRLSYIFLPGKLNEKLDNIIIEIYHSGDWEKIKDALRDIRKILFEVLNNVAKDFLKNNYNIIFSSI